MRIHSLSLLLVLLCTTTIGLRAYPDYYFKQISLQDGLSQSTVRCVLNDHNGFIWIGTKSGINRFDRHELKVYRNEPNNPNSLPGNLIHFITEDSIGEIWAATENGLTYYDDKTDCFTPVIFKGSPLKVRSYLHLKDGILFGGSGELIEYRYSDKEFRKITLKNTEQTLPVFISLDHWKGNLAVIGTRWHGLWIYNIKSHTLKRADFCSEQNIFSTFVDSNQNLWISPYNRGLLCYSKNGMLIAQYSTDNSKLSNNVILDIEEKDKKLWLATDGGGINLLDLGTKEITVIEHTPGNSYSLPVNSIYSLYKDNENNMWAGSIRGGVLAIKTVHIRTYRDVPLNNPFGLSEKTILCLHEDNEGVIWVGTDGGGINRLDPISNTFKHFPITYKDKIASITDYNEQSLLVSMFSKGIYLFNKETGKITPFIFINERENKKITQLAISVNVNKLSDNQIQFFSDKVYLYDINKKTYSEAKLKGNSTTSLSGLQLISSNEYVTYVFGEHNIFELNNRTKMLNTIFTLAEPSSIITSVTRDKNSNFWIGTTEGLISYNTLTYETKKIKTNLFSNVSSVKYDKNNRIWIGTQGMLFCYMIKENKFILLGESDGAFSNEYLPRPTLQSKSGDIYMGGVMGLVRINKNILFEDTTQPTIVLTDVLLNGVPVNPSEIVNTSLSVPWNHTSLGIKVMAREEDVFREKLFKYSIVGLNNQYFETYEHSLTLYTLPTGNYEIMVSCNTKDGSWSVPMKILSLSVMPPWWKSSWFIAFLILFIIGCITLGIKYVIRFKERKLKWEMKEHEQKTYEEKVRFLINISHELRTPLTLIYAPLKRMLKEEIKDEKLAVQLNGIYKQARQMKSIINMVLDVRKMEVGEDSLHLLPHPLNQWLSAIADDFMDELKAKNIQLLYDLDDSIEEVSFDEDKCEIVISNLLMNALKFSTLGTSITLSTQKVGDKVRISIKDQGIGLGGVDTSKLFTRFYQGNHDKKGSGIGLSYAKMLVEMHGGNIGAISNEDRGSTFYFELPLTNATVDLSYQPKPYLNELLYSPEEEEITTNDFSTKEYTLLVVEDEPELREFLRETLSEYFKQVYTAENGVVALTVINQASPSIVISDVMMPKMNGFELCKNIKKNIEISHIPVILLTARNDSGSTALGYKMGADAYLAKPFDTEFLMIIIRNQLKNREQMKARYKNFGLTIDPKEVSFSSVDEKFLLKLTDIIVNNISNINLDVQFVADNIGMSRASLYKKIKVLTNISVSDYITKYRIEKAMQLLEQSDINLATIAEQTGFGSQRYFSTVFKQVAGVTPTQYREGHRG